MSKYVGMAWGALVANKVRSLLTILGIVIGVMAVIVMIGLGQASQAYVKREVEGLGASVLMVVPGNPKDSAMGPGRLVAAQTLTLQDAEAMEKLPGVRHASPYSYIQTAVKVGQKTEVGFVIGCKENTQFVSDYQIAQGRFFTEQEERQGAKLVVLGATVAEKLFDSQPGYEPFKDKLKIENQRYRVVGILKKKGGGLGGDTDTQTLMPIRTYQAHVKSGDAVNEMLVKVESDEHLRAVQNRLFDLLRRRHKIRSGEDDDFKIQTQEEIMQTVGLIMGAFTVLLAGIASISLLVGGIGIMNIMLVSVTERTREIGIRKAVGAKRRDILMQFLLESASLSLAGGILGMLVGMAVTYAATRAANLPFVMSPVSVVGSFLFSAGVGIFFGLYPANKASKLDPVDALRYE